MESAAASATASPVDRVDPVDPVDLSGSSAPMVLVVDDSESIRRLIRINLELDGFVVEEACDGHAAMDRLIDPARPRPRVVVLDSHMAPRDGWWTIAAIRSHPPLDAVPVVLVTASVLQHDRTQAASAGFDAFVEKPFEPEHLVETVSRLAEHGRTPLPHT